MNDETALLIERAADNQVNVLVVADASVDRRMTGAIIEQNRGWRATYAEDSAAALAAMARETPSVVLTDIHMPKMNGLELVAPSANSTH